MSASAAMKLSQIVDHNYDQRTDQLYQPLRLAIGSMANSGLVEQLRISDKSNAALLRSQLKTSKLNISGLEQDIIKKSTLIPINKKLVETDNPEKKLRARSRSYRTISVEQKIGEPLNQQTFQQSIANPGKVTQIFYDYEGNQIFVQKDARVRTETQVNLASGQTEYYGSMTPRTMARPRSETYLGPIYEGIGKGADKVPSKTIQVVRKPSNNSSTSLQLLQSQERKTNNARKTEQESQYYQNCKKYTFKKEFKAMQPERQQKSREAVQNQETRPRMRSNDYKYNLFSMLDQQANLKCANGFCTKNEIVASRIQKRW